MADRTDIDALLIGALYGELTPADEARLTAHLESHPADRTALADLTRTREAVRGSRLLAFQAEPPQAISALLLREASRRAPRPERETTGWFQRFTRSFMAHPAMAAAATVVLVASVAGTFYLRGDDQLAVPVPKADTATTSSLAPGPAPGASADPTSADRPSTEQPMAPATAPPATAPPAVAAEPAPQVQQNTAPLAGSAGAGSYRVRLDDEAGRAEDAQRKQMVVVPSQAGKGEAVVGGKDAVPPAASPARAKMVKKPASIEVRTPERRIEPKELGDADDTGDLAKRNDRRDGAGAPVAQQRSHAGGGGPTGAASAPAPASPPAAAAMADQAPSPADATAGQRETAADAKKAAKPSPVAATPPPPPPPAPRPAPAASSNEDSSAPSSRRERGLAKEAKPARPVAPVAREDKADAADKATSDKAANDKAADDRALLDWARKRKDQVIALVGSNNCRAAASAAGEIYHRAPDYYAANVVTDRSIRPCLAYLNSERDRQERAKAAKRAIQADDAARTK